MIYHFMLSTIINSSLVIYELKHITNGLSKLLPFCLLYTSVLVVQKKMFCHKRGWVWSQWYTHYLLKHFWFKSKRKQLSNSYFTVFLKEHYQKPQSYYLVLSILGVFTWTYIKKIIQFIQHFQKFAMRYLSM